MQFNDGFGAHAGRPTTQLELYFSAENLINADLLLMKIELLHENYFHVAKTRSGKGEPRGYCRALKDIEEMVRELKEV